MMAWMLQAGVKVLIFWYVEMKQNRRASDAVNFTWAQLLLRQHLRLNVTQKVNTKQSHKNSYGSSD